MNQKALSVRSLALVIVSLTVAAAPVLGQGGHRSASDRSDRSSSRAASPTRAETRAQVDELRASVDASLDTLREHYDFDRAATELEAILDQAIAYAPLSESALFCDIAFALRLVRQLGEADPAARDSLLPFLLENEELARTLAFLVKPEDDVKEVYAILNRLRESSRRGVTSYAPLAAAISVVHDSPRRIRSSSSEEPRYVDPVALFNYFAGNAGQLLYSPRSTAPELLVYLVDTRVDIFELQWAFSRHRGDRNVHKRYGDIRYDTAAFKYNTPKRISEHAYTLENIRRYGGVCEEQAHYAAHAARAIGVPAIYISGRSVTVSHAWVGVVQQRGGGPTWYMEEGRFGDYRDLRGTTIDPQTNRPVPDDQVALSALVARMPMQERHAAIAYIDAARRVWARGSAGDPPPAPSETTAHPRALDNELALGLLERAARAAPGMPEIWLAMRDAARDGRLSAGERVRWFDAFYSAVGARHPDFCFAILTDIIASVPSPADQAAAWDWVLRRYRNRADLSILALIARGRAWQAAGDRHQAYLSFIEAVNSFGNDAPGALAALQSAEDLLREGNREGHILEMYRQAFQRLRRPSTSSAQFFRQSNYYQVGRRYATLLEQAGLDADARRIRSRIAAGDRD